MEIANNIIQVLTGSTVAILATLVYSTLTNAFLSGGSFRSKKEAVVIVLAAAFVLGIFTPTISNFWTLMLAEVNYIQIIGLLILVGTFTVNQMVHKWRHTTKPSLILYAIGLVLLISPYLVY